MLTPFSKAKLVNTSDFNLEGQIITIRGISSVHPGDIIFYIVQLEEGCTMFGYDCITIISSCLEPVKE